MTSAFIQCCAPATNRVARAAWRLIGVTAITACSRVDAASAPARTMRSADVPTTASFTTASFTAPPGTYDAVMAQRGKVHFNQYCAQCHVKAQRATSGTPRPYVRLRNLGRDSVFFADQSAQTLLDVLEHYQNTLQMNLSKAQQRDLVEYLKSH